MEIIPIQVENLPKAKEYLSSIGKIKELTQKNIEPAQWVSVIEFANQQIASRNLNQK